MATKKVNMNHQLIMMLMLLFTTIFLTSCKGPADDTSFVPCQSFDEFSMREIYTDSLVQPFLLVQRTDDTIRIIQSSHINDTMIYLNKGNYWYSSLRVKYDYSVLGNIINRFRPITFGREIRQQDVLRYILPDEIIEVFLCDINENESLEDYGCLPDCIIIHNKQSSKTYTFFNHLEDVIDSTILNTTIISQIYNYHNHQDTIPLDVTIYVFDCQKNRLYLRENGICIDTIQLNSLGAYHVPVYNFEIENGESVEGIFGDRMSVRTSCTTIETDKFANQRSYSLQELIGQHN